jgi:nitrogen regulatory protein P-II 1
VKLLIIILNKEEFLDDFVQGLLEVDVRGATILDSVGMGHILAQDIPIFAGLKGLLSGNRPHNKTLLTAIRDDQESKVVAMFEQVVGPLTEPGNGLIVVLPIAALHGVRLDGNA